MDRRTRSDKRQAGTLHCLSCYRWADKQAAIVGRELDLKTARKLAGKRSGASLSEQTDVAPVQTPSGFDHECAWREGAVKLARCVVWTLQTGGKLGMGSGMVMRVVDGKKTIERWDKDFIAALSFIGIEMVDKKPKKPTKRK